MASISRHLRNFARKPNEKLGPVALDEVVQRHAGDRRLAAEGGRRRARRRSRRRRRWSVRAGSVRLQQVLVNIISNAADAVEGLDRPAHRSRRRGARATRCVIAVRDHGPGVPDGDRRAHLRSVLLHQGRRQGARARPFDFLQHRQGFRRQTCALRNHPGRRRGVHASSSTPARTRVREAAE